MKVKTCWICSDDFSEWGNNPSPLGPSTEKCCDECNNRLVIPARIRELAKAMSK